MYKRLQGYLAVIDRFSVIFSDYERTPEEWQVWLWVKNDKPWWTVPSTRVLERHTISE